MTAPTLLLLGLALASGERAPRYDRDIRPILSDRCFVCHGPDAAKRRADLRLDQAGSALAPREGGAAIVPGKPGESELWKRITHHDAGERMPPAASGKRPLAAEEQALLRRWIESGAEYEPHWSFVAPVRPELPRVQDARWERNPIDRFVRAELEAHGLAPSPEAERATLLRRVFLDLTGLPPTPEELDSFLADLRPDAYERWVDRLLGEEPYRTRHAERMATPWLDAARYGDTNGIHTDAGRSIWPWRDWVLAAFRDGMPFDRFVTEQLAGDLLPGATDAQKVASGFQRNHVMTDEGGAIAEEYLVEYAVDRVNTTGSVFLGLSLGCARCHDHKFDPFTQEDYYALFAFYDSIEEPGLYSQLADSKRAFEPFLSVPSAEDARELGATQAELAELKARLDQPLEDETRGLADFRRELEGTTRVDWADLRLVRADSKRGATLAPQPDGSLLASGANPETDEHELVLETDGRGLRLLALEALTDPSLDHASVGRADNGNAVLTGFEVLARSKLDPARTQPLEFRWCWADFEQKNGDYRLANVLDADPKSGWAVDGHNRSDARVALFLCEEPFGFEGGTELVVQLRYGSPYAQHVFGRVRLSAASVDEAALARFPLFASGWYSVGPFPAADRAEIYARSYGPEEPRTLELGQNFGAGNQYWTYQIEFADARLNSLAEGTNASYVAKRVLAPSARKVEVAAGSDDGLRVYRNGQEVFGREVDRGLAADQDRFEFELPAGASSLVLKIVNTGGQAGFFWRTLAPEGELPGELLLALLPPFASSVEREARIARAWKLAFSPAYRELVGKIAAAEKREAEIQARIPRTMVMKELDAPRPTFVLQRGQYDKPDPARPVSRGVPRALGSLPAGAPANRLGLAQWLLAPENPLVARVAVNRLWEQCFGTGLVRTSEDFGLQGEWPSHPELLDWLALEFQGSGWDVKGLLRRIVTSATYRQGSRVRTEDPDGRLLSRYPRRRLPAEEIRDQALFVSGLLVEKLGGPSVKPYQPEGLWQEIAMLASNTRVYERGSGEDLWRRSLYTYWKRACPPPALQTFDAPTRESCTVRRSSTNTPLQSLVLWNDEQFVEAARALAQRTLAAPGADRERLGAMLRRATGRVAGAEELAALESALARFRARYAGAEAEAQKLVLLGMAPRAGTDDVRELAAWTMVASTLLNLDATISRS